MIDNASPEIPILILAAGQSRRMRGEDKLLKAVGGVTLLRKQALMARRACRARVFATLPSPPHPRYAALAGTGVQPVPVPEATAGMSASLRCGIAALPPEAKAVMILLADMPELTVEDLETVLHAVDLSSEDLIWRGAAEGDVPGHPIVVSVHLFDRFSALSGDVGGKAILAEHRDRTRLIPLPGTHAICDLDTPEAWADWLAGREKRQNAKSGKG
jgi:CTP:molybdopterin cytidylyltransferase MocA